MWFCYNFSNRRRKAGTGKWLVVFFGYIKTDYEYEWGYIRLSDFENIKLPFGLKFERDIYSEGTVRELM